MLARAILLMALVGGCGRQTATAAPQTRDLDLSAARIEGGQLSRGRVVPSRIFHLSATGDLWAQAEEPSATLGPVIVQDVPQASGGRYAVIPDGTYQGSNGGVVYWVDVDTPGAYFLWARTYWPDVGGNSLYLQLDEGDRTLFGNDEEPGHIGQWFWLRGPEWQLTRGLHRVCVWWREDGTRLDRIVLGPGSLQPEGMGPEAALAARADKLSIAFPSFRPPRVDRWLRAVVQVQGKAQSLRLAAFDQDGRRYDLPPDGDMSAIPVAAPLASGVRLQVGLRPGQDCTIDGVRLEYDGAPTTLHIGNESQRLTFDRTTGSLLQMGRADTAMEALTSESGPPFRLRTWDHETGDLAWTEPRQATLLGVKAQGAFPSAAQFEYRVPVSKGHCVVRCTIDASDTGHLPAWTIEVDSRGEGLDVVEVEYPLVRTCAVGGDASDDSLTWPYWRGAGRLIPNPARNGPGSGTYCSGRGMMHWLDLYDDVGGGRGLYLGAEDDTWLTGALRADGNPDAGAVELALSKMPRIGPGETWSSAAFRCGLHEGDWHAGADIYRAWIDRHIEYRPRQWVVETDGWLGRGRGTKFLQDIPAHYRLARNLGLNYVEFWGQMMVGLTAGAGGCNRLYFPDPRYGTEKEFAQAIRYVRQAGGHIGFYTNGQAWNPRYPKLRREYEGLLPEDVFIPDWEREYHRYGLVRPDGGYVPQYAKPSADDPYPGAFFLMCPSTEGWPRYLRHYIVGKYVKQYGVDAMYIDQVGAATAQWCFAPDHGHKEVGAWTTGHMENFRRIREEGQGHEPQFALATEGFGDCYGRDVDMFLISPTSANPMPDSYPGLLRYTLPDRVCLDGYANGNPAQKADREILNEVFLFGNRFDMFPRSPETMAYFRKVLALRQQVGPLLYRSRFMDDVGLDKSSPRVRALWWRLDSEQADGGIITMLNPDGVTGSTVSVPLGDDREPRAYVADLDRALGEAPCRVEGGRTHIDVPACPVSTALIVSQVRMDPPAIIQATAPVGAVGAPSEVNVRYRPIGPLSPGAIRVALETPPGWGVAEARAPAGEPADISLIVTPPTDSEKRAYDLVAVIYMPSGRTVRRPIKLLLHDAVDLRVELAGGQVTVSVTSNAVTRLEGTCTIAGPAWLKLDQAARSFVVEPRGHAEVVYATAGSLKIDRPGRITATVEAAGATALATQQIAPPSLALANWVTQNYEGEVRTRVEDPGQPGETLAVRTDAMDCRGGWQWRTGAVLPGTRWTFSGEVRAEDIKTATDGGARARIICFHRSIPNRGTRPTIFTKPVTGTTEWQTFEVSFDVPPETGRVQIELFNWHASGTSYWRNMDLQ